MLMTKYIYLVHKGQKGYHTVVTRVSDGATKYFYQASGSVEGLSQFLNSVTDELADGYFPRAGKKVIETDNWAYLGENPDRVEAERLAKLDLIIHKLGNAGETND